MLFSSCSEKRPENTDASEIDKIDYSVDDNGPYVDPGMTITEPDVRYRNDEAYTLAIIEVKEKHKVYQHPTRVICDYLYIYNKERLEAEARENNTELVLGEGTVEKYRRYFCYIDERCADCIDEGDVLLVTLHALRVDGCPQDESYARIQSEWDYKNNVAFVMSARYIDDKLCLDQSSQDVSLAFQVWISRLYHEEPRVPGSTLEHIRDGMTVEETIAFFKRVEDDVRRFEEDRSNIIYNEIF